MTTPQQTNLRCNIPPRLKRSIAIEALKSGRSIGDYLTALLTPIVPDHSEDDE